MLSGKTAVVTAQSTKEFVEASEVAAFVAFLCSTEAKSITAAVLPIDGGWTAR